MNRAALFFLPVFFISSAFSATTEELEKEIQILKKENQSIQETLTVLQKKWILKSRPHFRNRVPAKKKPSYPDIPLTIRSPYPINEELSHFPSALVADGHVVTYIAGTAVITSPYLGDRPAFDGSDYIVNISSINRDIRLMQQRRLLYQAWYQLGFPGPERPLLALSGKAEPVAVMGRSYAGNFFDDLSLGSSELDIAAILNPNVEAFLSIAYDDSPPPLGGQRVSNSAFSLNMGFVNIGNLDVTPFYLTAGQMYVPFGRYSSSMTTAPLTMVLARTKARPFILGYKSQMDTGPYLAAYGFISDTRPGKAETGGLNAGYQFRFNGAFGDIGAGYIGTIADSQGMQNTGSLPNTTFGGFGSINNGSENIPNIPAADFHANISFDRYSLTAEWVGAVKTFPSWVLSMQGIGARPQAAQLEAAVTFTAFAKPASLALGYQWSKDALALNLPKNRLSAVFNISIWRDTVESLEFRHDNDYGAGQFANGIAAPGFINLPTFGTGSASNTIIAQIGVYF